MNELYSAEFWQQCPTPAAAAAAGLFYGHGAGGGHTASDACAPYLNAAAAAAAAVAAPYLPLDAALAAFGQHNNNNNNVAEHRQQPPPADNPQSQLFQDGKYFGGAPANVIVSGASAAAAAAGGAAFPNLHHIHNTFFGPGFGSAAGAAAPFPNSLQSLGLVAATAAVREPPLPYPTLNLFNSQQQIQQQQQQHVPHRIQQQQQQPGGNNNNQRHNHHHHQQQQQQPQQQQQLFVPSAFDEMLAADLLDLGHQQSRQAAAAAAAELKPAGKTDDRKRVLSGQENQNNNANNNTAAVGGFLWARSNNNNNNDIPAGDHISADSLKPITIPFVSCQKSEAENGALLSPSNHFHHAHSSNSKHQPPGNDGGGGASTTTTPAQTCQACMCAQSNGLHFGAKTCAACAAFFRRSVSDNKVYQCKRSQRCVIKPGDTNGYRKMCRACRMQRCLDIGMQSANVQNKRHRRDFYFGDGFTLADGSAGGNLLTHTIPTVRPLPHSQQQQCNQQQQQQRQQLHVHTQSANFSPVPQQSQRAYGNDMGANNTVLNSIFARMNPAPPAAASLFSAMPHIPFSVANDSLRCPNTVINHGLHDVLQHHGGAIAPAAAAAPSALFGGALDRRLLFGGADELMDVEANKPIPAEPTVGYGKADHPTTTAAAAAAAPRQGSVIIAPTHFPHVGKELAKCGEADLTAKARSLDYGRQLNDEGLTAPTVAALDCGSERKTDSQPITVAITEKECHKLNDPELVGNGFYGTTARGSTPLRISSISMLDSGVPAENYAPQAPPVTSTMWLTPNVSHQIAFANS